MTTFQKIYEVAGQIPEGFVATYGQVAAMAGNPRWARVVGYALHVLPDPAFVPWHRVVAKDGRISTASGERSKNCSRNKFTECSTGIVFPSLSVDQRVPHFFREACGVCNDRVT